MNETVLGLTKKSTNVKMNDLGPVHIYGSHIDWTRISRIGFLSFLSSKRASVYLQFDCSLLDRYATDVRINFGFAKCITP